jgi:hypothetical protein
MTWKRKDTRELMLQDQARGKNRVRGDPDKVQEHRDLLRDMRTLLKLKDEVTFLNALIIDYQLSVDSPMYQAALKAWRTLREDRGFSS